MTDPLDSIPELLRKRVESSPNTFAFWHQAEGIWQPTTWRQFYARSLRLVSGLVSRGLTPGMHVGLLASTGIEWEVAHHAALIAGGVVVGLDPHDTADRLHWIISHADVSILIVENRNLFDKIAARGPLDLRLVVFIENGAEPFSDSEAQLSALAEAHADDVALPAIRSDASATLIYTSGTTGQPKGILYRHGQVVLAIRAITAAYPSIEVGSRFVCWLPLSNLFQRIMNLAAMQVGGTVYLVGNPLEVLKSLPTAKPDIFIGVPRFYEKLHEGMQKEIDRKPRLLRHIIRKSIALALDVSRSRRGGEDVSTGRAFLLQLADRAILSKLRTVMGGRIQFMITGSAPTPVRLLEFFHAVGLPLYEAYGMSENVIPMALNRADAYRFGTVGKPIEVNELKTDTDGELLVRGPGVFSGYYKDNRTDHFTDDGFYRTGDYGRLDEQGFLALGGRKSEIIKTSTGRRISPSEVEEMLAAVRGVERAVVIGNGRKCLLAIVTLGASFRTMTESLQIDSLRDALRRSTSALPSAHRPGGFLILDYEFSIENGELTTNLKLRRSTIEKRLVNAIDQLYEQIELEEDKIPVLTIYSSTPPRTKE